MIIYRPFSKRRTCCNGVAAFGFALSAILASSAIGATFEQVILSRQKQNVPGSTPLRFGSFGQPAFNDKEDVTFYSTIYGQGVSSSSNAAIFMRVSNHMKLVAREGVATSINGSPFVLDSLTTNPLINKKSHVFWSGTYQPSGNPLYNTIYNIAARNAVSSGIVQITNTTVGSEPVADFNAKDNISVIALYTGVLNTPLTVFRANTTGFIGLVSVGDVAIGMPLGTTYASFGAPTLDQNNVLYFVASVSATTKDFDGIWFGKTGDPNPLATTRVVAPGTGGNKFTTFADSPDPSPRGKLCAFSATAGSTNGIWVVDVSSGDVTEIAVDGTSASGLIGATLANFQPPAINDNGQVAFLAKPTVAGTATLGLFFGKSPGTIEKVIAVGDAFTLRGTTVRVIDIRFSQLGGLNKLGEMVCTLSFDDRSSGIFIVTP